MRRQRSVMWVGLLIVAVAAICWRKCCGPHLRRRRAGQTGEATETVSAHTRRRECGAGVIAILMAILALAAPAVAAASARMTLATDLLLGGGTHLTVTVTDARGNPMKAVVVTLRAKTTFGWLRVTEATTDPRGQIHAVLPASSRFTEIVAEAAADAETVQAAVRLERGPISAPGVRPGRATLAPLSPQPGFISPYPVPWLVLVLGVILGGVWVTYGRVIFLLVQIRRGR